MIKRKKTVYAVTPFLRPKGNNFKMQPFEAWKNINGKTASEHYPFNRFHAIAYKIDFPSLRIDKQQARLRFVEVQSLTFDSFPDYIIYEIIPIIWDCWPSLDNKIIHWIKRHKIRNCVFTSEEAASRISSVLPYLNILVITEGIDIGRYAEGKLLKDRTIVLYSYGRLFKELYEISIDNFRILRGGNRTQLFERLQDAKITIALPQCDVNKEKTGGQETLTQRFWECMLSRTVLLGRAPKELMDLIGYNPVIDIDYENYEAQIKDIVAHIEDYQELVDKNRETALRMASWEIRMKQVMEWLTSLGYEV